jgi:hypothetical protein
VRIFLIIGAVMAATGLTISVAGNLGTGVSVPALVGGGLLFVVGSTMAITTFQLMRGLARQAAAVRELRERGVRRTGTVRDAVPYAAAGGGAVLSAAGAQMVLQVELPTTRGGVELVTCHVVEPSAAAQARIGQLITVLEHPDDRTLRAVEGFLPNGRPVGSP